MKHHKRLVASGLALIMLLGLAGCGKKNNEVPKETDNPNNEYVEPSVVPDVKDKITKENVDTVLGESKFLHDNFDITTGKTYNIIRLDYHKYRTFEYDNYRGESKDGTTNFDATVSQGLSGNPEVSLSFSTTSFTEEEIEEAAYDIFNNICGKDILNQVKNTEYNDVETVVDDAKLSSYITIQKMKNDYGDNVVYSYGVKYQAGEDNIKEQVVYKDYDRKLYLTLPAIASTNIDDLDTMLSFAYVMMAQDLKDITLDSYSYVTTAEGDTCNIGLSGYTMNDERIVTSMVFNYSNETGLIDYSYDTMTGYLPNINDALKRAVDTISGYEEVEYTTDDFELLNPDESNDATGYTYTLVDEETMQAYTIDINHEFGIGYFATISKLF